jgi:hypothetical protein
MQNIEINHYAAIAAALSAFIIGGLWYSPVLFGKAWMRETGLTEGELKKGNMAKIFGLSVVLSLIMSYNLAAFLSGPANLGWGIAAGGLAGIGWVGLAFGVNYLFERKSFTLFLINAGYNAITFMIMGAIIGAWK